MSNLPESQYDYRHENPRAKKYILAVVVGEEFIQVMLTGI